MSFYWKPERGDYPARGGRARDDKRGERRWGGFNQSQQKQDEEKIRYTAKVRIG